jgi:hypothetical protein
MTALAKIHQHVIRFRDDRSTARAPITVTRPDRLEVFCARCWARAVLFAAGEIELPEAVDGLQAAAESSGLVEALGQDEVQAVIAAAFAGAEL